MNHEAVLNLYRKVSDEFDEVLRKNLADKDEETRDAVEQLVLDEYRPWNYEK